MSVSYRPLCLGSQYITFHFSFIQTEHDNAIYWNKMKVCTLLICENMIGHANNKQNSLTSLYNGLVYSTEMSCSKDVWSAFAISSAHEDCKGD